MPSSFSTKIVLRLALLLFVIQLNPCCVSGNEDLHKETTDHGAKSRDEEERHERFEHSAILGSKKEVEEFEDLPPEEAKRRLRGISKLMDKNKDGSIDKEELKEWILNSFESLTQEEAAERFAEADRNGDKRVTWEEHLSEAFGDDLVLSDAQEAGKHTELVTDERELFAKADADSDSHLTIHEYVKLMQPQEFPEMQKIYVKHVFRKKDLDKDGKISMEEFLKDDPETVSKEHILQERERFVHELDKNKDGVLDFDEFFAWVIPDNKEIAEQEVEHLMDISDTDRDGKLSVDEVVDHYDSFVGSEATDYGEHLIKYKDEL